MRWSTISPKRPARVGVVLAVVAGFCLLSGFGYVDDDPTASAGLPAPPGAGTSPSREPDPAAPVDPLGQPAAPDPALARLVELTNAERRRAGAPPLAVDPQLGLAARRYAAALAGGACFAHDCGPVPALTARVGATGYAWARLGENLAAGQQTPEDVVAAWLASPGHRANLLDPAVTELGLGRAAGGPYGAYWVQVLATPAPASTIASGGDVQS